MPKKPEYIGAYYDDKHRLRPITAPKGSHRKVGIPMKLGGDQTPRADRRIPLNQIKNIKNHPRIFYRGTTPSSGKNISTGNDYWDKRLFMSSSKKLAKNYGETLETIVAKKDAKILYEGTREFKAVAGEPEEGQRLFDFWVEALHKAEEKGYDAVHFKRQGDVGTAVINPDKFIRNYNPPQSSREDFNNKTHKYADRLEIPLNQIDIQFNPDLANMGQVKGRARLTGPPADRRWEIETLSLEYNPDVYDEYNKHLPVTMPPSSHLNSLVIRFLPGLHGLGHSRIMVMLSPSTGELGRR